MNYVIIGGDAAGMSAAMQLYRHDPDAHITVLEKGSIYSYGQCGLPYVVGGLIDSTDDVIARTVETFRTKYGIDARIRHEATDVDADQKTVSGVDHATSKTFTISYDRLLIATGASPLVPTWKGADRVHVLKTIPDTNKLIDGLQTAENVVVIGAGYIGLEAAENIAHLGKRVTLIQRSSAIGTMFDIELSERLEEEAKRNGVRVVLNEEVESIEDGFVYTNGGRYKADLVVAAVGVTPNTAFLKRTGMKMLENGAIIVDDQLKTSVPHIYAAGDCATHFHRITKKPDYIPLGTTANKQGRIAGLNMAGNTRIFRGITGTSVLKFFNLIAASTGVSEEKAAAEGLQYEMVTLETKNKAGYYPDWTPLFVKLIYHKKTRQLLGGQAIGQEGADKRIDVLAAALFAELTIDDLEDLDLSYAPPVNGVWDPVQQAARRAK